MSKCCICNKTIDRDDAPVLSMGAAGNPRLLCDECEALLDTATSSREYEEIEGAMDSIGQLMTDGNPDGVTFSTVNEIMVKASVRAKLIKEGEYDFSLDEQSIDDGGLEEIPEDMLESEEDIAKDKEDEEKMKKFDKLYNYMLIGCCVAFVAMLIWKIVDTFLLK